MQGTPGAEFHQALDRSPIQEVFSKGTDPSAEAYSAFDRTGLGSWLHEHGVERLFLVGLTTDYCIRASALDGLQEGFEVVVLEDGIAAVNAQPGDGERALVEMRASGAVVANSADVAD